MKSQMHQIHNMNNPWKEILHYATPQFWAKKKIIIPANKESFYFLETGHISIVHGNMNGKNKSIFDVREGSLFHVADIISNFFGYTFELGGQFYCVKDCKVWVFPAQLITSQEFRDKHPEQMYNLLLSLGAKLSIMHAMLSNMTSDGAYIKFCRFVLKCYQDNGKNLSFAPNISQAEISNLIGIHRITLVNMIKSLKEEGIISEFTKTRATITNLDKLMQIVANYE